MIHMRTRGLSALLIPACLLILAGVAQANRNGAESAHTRTPIKHVIVIFQENVSFDHYFATYPHATNPTGEPAFHARWNTPRVNNLLAGGLLDENPNSSQPFRLDLIQAVTCDQDHDYADEQKAHNHGLMDKFPESVGTGGPGCPDYGHGPGIVMGYYDGNTVTALWNYAQYFAMSDNSFGTTFGPSTPGALNLVAGNTAGATLTAGSAGGNIAGGASTGAVIGDPRPEGDDCNPPTAANHVSIVGRNAGDLLNAKNLSWGWFQGGFRRTSVDSKEWPPALQPAAIWPAAPATISLTTSHSNIFLRHKTCTTFLRVIPPRLARPTRLITSMILMISGPQSTKGNYRP